MIILIGSRAARAWYPAFRQPSDWDAIASADTIRKWCTRNSASIRSITRKSERKRKCRMHDGTRIEFEIMGADVSTEMLRDLSSGFRACEFPGGATALAATPALLALNKRSHAYWPIHWFKTMEDLHWLRLRAPEPTADERAFYVARLAEHTARFGQRRVNLAMTNEAFFAKSAKQVMRAVEHDTLHEQVAYHARPLFEKFKTDLGKAALSRTLFEQASLSERHDLVREEAMVIALERFIIPALPSICDPSVAYAHAVRRICTDLTSGWFRDFAIDHWPTISQPNKEYVVSTLTKLGLLSH